MINNAKILSHSEEVKLIESWQKNKCEKSLNNILNAYMRLINSISNKYLHYGLQKEDLIQEGIVGMIYALDKFDLSKGYRLSTYARWWIRALIQDYILKNWSIVRTGSSASQKALFFNLKKLKKLINHDSFNFMNHHQVKKIATILNVKTTEVEKMESRLSKSDQSLNQEINEDGGNDLISLLKDESPTQDVIIEEYYDNKEKKTWLYQAIELLRDREKIIIHSRKLQDKAKTLEDLGKSLNISKERVRQIETEALKKLQENLLKISNQSKDFFLS